MSTISPKSYKRHRFPAAIISKCVWLYYRFVLSFRDVERKRSVNHALPLSA